MERGGEGVTIEERLGVEEDADVDEAPLRGGEYDGGGGFGGGGGEPADVSSYGDVAHFEVWG